MIEQPADHSARTEQTASKRSLLEDGIHNAVGFFLGDDAPAKQPGKTNLREEVEHYSAEVLKTAPLFLPAVGRLWAVAGYGGSALLQGLDQVHSGDSSERQAADFALGFAKGALTKGTFELLGKADFGALNKAVDWGVWPKALGGAPLELTGKAFSFGLSNRLLDTSLTSQTWLDQSGRFDVAKGLHTTAGDMVRPSALLTDVAVFAGSPILLKGANVAFRGALDRSPLAQTIGTGSSFGLLSGSLSETQRQYNEDAHFDLGKIAMRGFLQAGATGLGATAGGFRANYLAFHPSLEAGETKTDVKPVEARQSRVPDSSPSRSAEPAWKAAGLFADAIGELAHANLRDASVPEPASIAPMPTNATPAELLGIKAVERSGTHMDTSEGALFGAKQYRTEDGMEFWQLADGRILHQTVKERKSKDKNSPDEKFENPTFHIWVPNASEDRYSSGKLEPFKRTVETPDGRTEREDILHLSLDERHGIHRDIDGAPNYPYSRLNLFDSKKHAPAVDRETMDRLQMVAPNAEKDWQSATRILPTETGDLFESSKIHSWQKVPGEPRLNGKPSEWVQFGEQPGRIYRILTQEQAVQLADLKEQLASGAVNREAYNEGLRNLSSEAVSVLVPESYAQRLDALRDLRRIATLSPNMVPEIAEDILKARRELFTSPYRDRLLPEQMGQYLEPLPDRSRLGELYMLDGSGKQYSFGVPAADAVESLRRVRIFAGADSATNPVREILKHEWTHLVQDRSDDLFHLYNAARRLDGFLGREYAKENDHEHWAVNLGEMFLDADSELFLSLAHAAPIKTVVLADAMSRVLDKTPVGQGSADVEELKARLDYVKQVIEPIAKQKLMSNMQSKLPGSVARVADVIASFSSKPWGQQLLDRLFDKSKLIQGIDKSSSEKTDAGQFDWQFEARRLMRLEMLRNLDPSAFAAREPDYNRTLITTAALTRAFMLTGDHPDNLAVRKFGASLAESTSLRNLFADLYPTSELVRASLNTKDEAAAKQAFGLITSGAPNGEAGRAALEMLQHKGPARLDAAEFLMGDKQLFYMRKGAESLSKLVDKRVPEFVSPEFTKYLSDGIDKALDLTFDPVRVVRTLHRGLLLEKILQVNPSLDEGMKERLAHLNNVKLRARDWVAGGLKTSPFLGAGSEVPVVMDMLDGISRSDDKSVVALAKELAPRMVLEQALRTVTVNDPRLLDVAIRLYGSEMNPLVLQLATSDGLFRDAAVRHGVGSSNLELLKQIKPVIDQFPNWGDEKLRLALIDDCTRRVRSAVERPDLKGKLRERMALRVDMLKELSKPMRMDLYAQPMDELSDLIELAERRLKETAPAQI
jgi:hypothetical protein